MARPNPSLISALRTTADRLEKPDTRYEWGHMARCNCGHLAQTITGFDEARLRTVVRHQMSEWSEHARDFCASTGEDVAEILAILESTGFGPDDVRSLEHLSDPDVLARLPETRRHALRRNDRSGVVLYLRAMADLLEAQIPTPNPPSTPTTSTVPSYI